MQLRHLVRVAVTLLPGIVLAGALLACKKKDKEEAPSTGAAAPVAAQTQACAARFSELAPAPGGSVTCSCVAGAATGSVWGTDLYTTDSSVCAAAVHAGVVTAAGGEVTVKAAPGCPSYAGSARNGIDAGNWGEYQGSFYFPSKGDGKCTALASCPGSFKEISGSSATTEHTCTCGAVGDASVWGSSIYTADSSICRAAAHAGVIPASGGTVKVKGARGCSSYQGTTQNGITTSRWPAYDLSFYFPARGDGVCK